MMRTRGAFRRGHRRVLLLVASLLVLSMELAHVSRAQPPSASEDNAGLSNWVETTSPPTSRFGHAAVTVAGNLYLIGGYNGPGWTGMRSVVRAPIRSDGALGAWQPARSLINARGGVAAVAAGSHLYAIGGAIALGVTMVPTIERARVNADGSLADWEVIATLPESHVDSLPEGRVEAGAVVVDDYLFVIGGRTYYGTAGSKVIRARITADGALGPWVPVAPPDGDPRGAVAAGAFIFALNDDGTVEHTIMQADGTLAPWIQATFLATNHRMGTLAVLDTDLYVLGGRLIDGAASPSVERARINPDGTLGPWEVAPSMRFGRASFAVATWAPQIYASGGDDVVRGPTATVEYARSLRQREQWYLPLVYR